MSSGRSNRAPCNNDRSGEHRSRAESVQDNSVEARIGKAITVQPDGCWTIGTANGYVRRTLPSGNVAMHRWVYETLVGPVPEGHHLHHKCQRPSCCNPSHLEPLTPKEHKAAHRRLPAAPQGR